MQLILPEEVCVGGGVWVGGCVCVCGWVCVVKCVFGKVKADPEQILYPGEKVTVCFIH